MLNTILTVIIGILLTITVVGGINLAQERSNIIVAAYNTNNTANETNVSKTVKHPLNIPSKNTAGSVTDTNEPALEHCYEDTATPQQYEDQPAHTPTNSSSKNTSSTIRNITSTKDITTAHIKNGNVGRSTTLPNSGSGLSIIR